MTSGSGVQLEILRDISDDRALGGLDHHGPNLTQQRLGRPVIGQAQPHSRRHPAGGKSEQLTGDGLEPRDAEQSVKQAKNDRVVARRPSGVDQS